MESQLRQLSKLDAYEILSNLKETDTPNIDKYMSMMIGTNTVPYDVIVFINKYHPLEQLETYNRIYEKRRKNQLYHNLVNESLPDVEKALALSSLITQTFIKMKTLNEEDRKIYGDIMNVPIVAKAISDYATDGNTVYLNEVFMMVRDTFKKLFQSIPKE